MRVLIIGQAKSGTTALHRLICDALGVEPDRGWFEPDDLRDVPVAKGDQVVKKLLGNLHRDEEETFDVYDHKLLLVRDPRDRLVSWLLYDIYGHPEVAGTRDLDRYLKQLRAKEHDPQRINFLRLTYTYWQMTGVDLLGSYSRSSSRLIDFWLRNRPTFQRVKYADLVAEDLGELAELLGVGQLGSAEVSEEHQRVVRTKGSGDWRHWFTEKDLLWLRPMATPELKRFRHGARWQLADEPHIDPEHASLYVERLLQSAIDDRARKPGRGRVS